MPHREFTQRGLDALKPDPTRRLEVWDALVPGLVLRVTPQGVKSYAVRYRVNGEARRFTIGVAGRVSLADARQRAREILSGAGKGEDAATVKQKARVEAQKRDLVGEDFEALARRCLDAIARDLRPRSLVEYRRALEHDAFPAIGKLPPKEIERGHIRALLTDVATRAPIQANRTFAAVRRVFSWAVEHDLLPSSPCAGVKAPSKETERDRVYSNEEIRAILKGAQGTPLRHLIPLVLYTAVRSEEARSARWSDVDLETRLWTIPAERAKNGKANPIPLSAGAVRALKAIPRDGEYLFPHVSGYLPHDQDAVEDVRAASGVADVRLHDVRRTVATRLAALGVLPDVIELILGHTLPKLQRTYQTHSFEREKRAALEVWSTELDGIVRGKKRARAEVVVMRRA